MLERVETTADIAGLMNGIGRRARKAARKLATLPSAQKNEALRAMATAVRAKRAEILAANALDVEAMTANGRPWPIARHVQLKRQQCHYKLNT